jgi:hypothetical protein
MVLSPMSIVLPMVREGKLRALAVTSLSRSSEMGESDQGRRDQTGLTRAPARERASRKLQRPLLFRIAAAEADML